MDQQYVFVAMGHNNDHYYYGTKRKQNITSYQINKIR